MIRFIKGTLAMIENAQEIVIENQGIGYLVSVPLSVSDALPPIGETVFVYTYMNVREDALQLFGFLSRDDLKMFQLLITVNGIGPKAALGILGTLTADDIRYAVVAEDAKTIAKAPGIGTKTAHKLILELKDKINLDDMLPAGEPVSSEPAETAGQANADRQAVQDAIEALIVLGYPKADAAKAVHKVPLSAEISVEELLKASLKNL
ncbi:MAG: Holliday junction branch migration protein RuvA [Clostridiaceae bacterium]|nr:Holliday junction branch migration protein RuvA [Clostridiaceae bacterium]